jgi:hypothetical protein
VYEAFRLLLACVCASAGRHLTRVTAGAVDRSKVVDIYNSASGTWSTDQLSVAGTDLATSVGNLAIFTGGGSSNCSFATCYVYMVCVEVVVRLRFAFEAFRRLLSCFALQQVKK